MCACPCSCSAHAQAEDEISNYSGEENVRKVRDRARAAGDHNQKLAFECMIFALYATLFIVVLFTRRHVPENFQITKAVEHALHADFEVDSGDSSQMSHPWPSTTYAKQAVRRRYSLHV